MEVHLNILIGVAVLLLHHQCSAQQCGNPPEIAAGYVSQLCTSYSGKKLIANKTATYSCDDGSEPNPPTLTCETGGQGWGLKLPACGSGGDCRDVPAVEGAVPISNTRLVRGVIMKTVRYFCLDGSDAFPSERTCIVGKGWDSTESKCGRTTTTPRAASTTSAEKCDNPPEVEDGYLSGILTFTRGQLTRKTFNYTCFNGEKPVPESIRCTIGGVYDPPVPSCRSRTTVSTTASTPGRPLPSVTPGTGDPRFSNRRGPQCKYDLVYPHTMCLPDSNQFLGAFTITANERQIILDQHNRWRGNVNPPAVPPLPKLLWDEDLAITAERWAAQCAFRHDIGTNRYLPDRSQNGRAWRKVGQNMCFSSTTRATWMKCITDWANERFDWKWGEGVTTEGAQVGHYTQMVDRRTLFVGCGRAKCNGRFEDVKVCNYAAAGNVYDRETGSYYAKPYLTS